MASEPVISKSDFAVLARVHPSRVTRWISEGKIYGEALVGEGRNAKIIASIAFRQLRMSLDVGQRLGNGAKTNLKAPPQGKAAAKSGSTPPADSDHGEDDGLNPALDEQIKREKLREAQIRNRKAVAAEREREGLYTLTSDVAQAMNVSIRRLMSTFEQILSDLSDGVARRHGTEPRDEFLALQDDYREARAVMAERAAKLMADLPKAWRAEASPEGEPAS